MLADSAPFATVAPSATSGPPVEDASAFNLSAEIAELSISSPASSPLFHTESLASSPTFSPTSHSQQSQACDPKALGSPVTIERPIIQPGPSTQAEDHRCSRALPCRASTADSDYSPSGESEVEDENDHSYGEPSNRKKTRSARVSHAAHPYLRPAPKPRTSRRRGTKLEIPTPVPGLTKNSRGRCVPKKTEGVLEDGSRPFWCHVKDCDKLFNRGEHLKRHILSIHTDDRPFQCECKNVFSRRDNLFQHMRAKGCVVWYKNGVAQCGIQNDTKSSRVAEDAEDRYIERIMADAKIAQNKRDRACKQARLGS
ncbi:hypothetical protein BDM02DRAFT_3096939 [Thelephora ganbajun]|uniref:Uncharacterized protein n=1 Tax=Thelephora ganbajun TaxID=370292 RepID=A0ACB6ZFT4_THEGA|nr:hypothetical protein BDM02DRAFT_3096939 [Thelephora ganbajun]